MGRYKTSTCNCFVEVKQNETKNNKASPFGVKMILHFWFHLRFKSQVSSCFWPLSSFSSLWCRSCRKELTRLKIHQRFRSYLWHHNVQGICWQNYQPLRHIGLVNSSEWIKATNPVISTCRCWHQPWAPLLHGTNFLDLSHVFQLLCLMPIQSAVFCPHQLRFQTICSFPLKTWAVLRRLPWTAKAFRWAMIRLMNYF